MSQILINIIYLFAHKWSSRCLNLTAAATNNSKTRSLKMETNLAVLGQG